MNVIEVLANRPDDLRRKGFADILLETSPQLGHAPPERICFGSTRWLIVSCSLLQ
jgi:hypothetical protein